MADMYYEVETSEVTAAMRTKASKDVDVTYFKVLSADVEDFEAMLPANDEYYISSESVVSGSGEQSAGILLPKKVVEG